MKKLVLTIFGFTLLNLCLACVNMPSAMAASEEKHHLQNQKASFVCGPMEAPADFGLNNLPKLEEYLSPFTPNFLSEIPYIQTLKVSKVPSKNSSPPNLAGIILKKE